MKTPDVKTPDVKTPDVKTPDTHKTPDVKTPDTHKTPDVKTPDTHKAPDTHKVPDKMPNEDTRSGDGYLEISSKPRAKVGVDGTDTGMTTPIGGKSLKLAPGKHKITFSVGDDKFTFTVVIKPGETLKLDKVLQ